jgi:putative redox protein
LISLGTCVSGTVLPLLRKMKKKIDYYEVKIGGERRSEHPTSFSIITIDIVLRSTDIENNDMETVLKMAEEKYCPLWAMIKNNVVVKTNYQIIKT